MESVPEIKDPRTRSCWIEIDLDNLLHNNQLIQDRLPEKGSVLAVVKADAYGHGASMIAHTLNQNGVDFFGVATLEEALKLRKFGIDSNILIMGHTTTFTVNQMITAKLTPVIFSYRMLKALDKEAARLGTKATIHLKIDTGMGRLGLLPEAVPAYLKELKRCNNIKLQGVATHFACASEDPKYTTSQLQRFKRLQKLFEQHGLKPDYWHIDNSAGIFCRDHQTFQSNLFRPGITLYGYPPDENLDIPGLKPVMSLRSKLADYKQLPAGMGISYGRTFIPEKPTQVGVIPLGYADGYPRSLSNRSYVLKGGQEKPVRGSVCMDMTVIELNPQDDPEETVTLMGEDNGAELWADQLADWDNTITYEVLCRFSSRIPRVYFKNRQAVAIKTDQTIHFLTATKEKN